VFSTSLWPEVWLIIKIHKTVYTNKCVQQRELYIYNMLISMLVRLLVGIKKITKIINGSDKLNN
jgi:hypothetical protein